MENKRLITSEDLLHIKVISEPQLSPCGEKLLYVLTEINSDQEYESHLFYKKSLESEPIQWTFGKVRDSSPSWSPDGRTVAFVSNRTGTSQIWLISLDGGEAQQLTFCPNGASQPTWSPDGKSILIQTYLTKNETQITKSEVLIINRLKYKSDAEGFDKGKRKQLAIINVNSKEIVQLTTGDFDHSIGTWSPDGKSIAFSANRSQNPDYQIISDIYILSIETKELTLLTNEQGIFTLPTWSPDGRTIACIGHEKEYEGATLNQIYTIDIKTKKRECLTGNWDVQIGDVAIGDVRSGHSNPGALWAKDGKRLFFTASEHGNTGLYQLNNSNEISPLYAEHNQVFGFSIHTAQEKAVLGISDPSNPGDLFLLSFGETKKKRLTNVNKTFLREVELAIPEPISTTSTDGWTIHGWMMKPIGFEEGKKYPMILEIHGGPHAMYGNTFFHELQLLAAKGYVVVYSNPRGSHGYGQKFVNACRGDYGGKDYEDLMSIVDEVASSYNFIDHNRLGVTGGSYGGFMTNWIVGHTNRFKAAVTLRSISNWVSFYGVSDIGYFFTKWEIGTCFLEDPDKLWNHSPLRYVNNIETPLLIMHGEKDYRCPIEQAEQLYVALKHQKKETTFIRFPEANHELSRSGPPHLRLARLDQITSWFADKL